MGIDQVRLLLFVCLFVFWLRFVVFLLSLERIFHTQRAPPLTNRKCLCECARRRVSRLAGLVVGGPAADPRLLVKL